MAAWSIILAAILAFAVWFYWNIVKPTRFWRDRGVAGPESSWILGNMREMLKENRSHTDLRLSQQYGSMYGYFIFRTPALVISDVALIKQILVKDFHHFVNRQKLYTYHEMWNENLLNAEDEKWRTIRSITSPAFTSGKLKGMHRLMRRCIDNLVTHLDKASTAKGGIIEDAKQFCSCFAIDVIAGTSFATETNANESPDSALVVNATQFFNINPLRGVIAFTFPPFLSRLLGVRSFLSPGPFEYFIALTRAIVRQRKAAGEKGTRNDLIQLLMDSEIGETELATQGFDTLTATVEENRDEIKQSRAIRSSGPKRTLTEDEIIAQCVIFFSGGFETTALTLFHTAYELARNPSVQERLHQAVVEATDGLDESSDRYFDVVVHQIDYLDAVLKETLRRYPPITVLSRRVKTDGYVLAGVPLPKDLLVETSVYAVHHNPEYYPEPEVYNPERFLPENKHLLVPYTYLPFGAGPRNCMGLRFAYQELKLVLAKLVARYRFGVTAGTPEKPAFAPGLPLLVTQTFPLKVSKRE